MDKQTSDALDSATQVVLDRWFRNLAWFGLGAAVTNSAVMWHYGYVWLSGCSAGACFMFIDYLINHRQAKLPRRCPPSAPE